MNLEESFIKHVESGDIVSMKKIYLDNDISINIVEDSLLLAYDLGYLDINTIKDKLINIYQNTIKNMGH